MSKYKLGDKILVRESSQPSWVERIYLRDLKGGHVACVDVSWEKAFKDGKRVYEESWLHHKPLPKEEYVPFSYEDRHDVIGKVVEHKDSPISVKIITECQSRGIHVYCQFFFWRQAFNELVFSPSGKPFGKKVEK